MDDVHMDDLVTDLDDYVDNDFTVPRSSTYAIELEAKVRATLALERIASSLERG